MATKQIDTSAKLAQKNRDAKHAHTYYTRQSSLPGIFRKSRTLEGETEICANVGSIKSSDDE